MKFLQRFLAFFFLIMSLLASWQCARRGSPSGGPKDVDPPILIRAIPENLSTSFNATKIRLYFDEYIRLQDVQNQLIISPPLKNTPTISPQGSASKYIEITLKDTLLENTTYTLNFGQSIVDNNEGNAAPFITYVFSTGTYIDSLELNGKVEDAFNRNADPFISVVLYEIDSAYTDSTIYKKPPYYITNTLDSTTNYTLRYLKQGSYALFAIKDEGKNNVFDQGVDKIGFVTDTIQLPADTAYTLRLFREIPDYLVSPPILAASNRIIFGYRGSEESPEIESLTPIADSILVDIVKQPGKDTLNYWFTPFEFDSLQFAVKNEQLQQRDTFTVKGRNLLADSLVLTPSKRGAIGFADAFYLESSIPIIALDTSKISFINGDSVSIPFSANLHPNRYRMNFDFEKLPNTRYGLTLLPEALRDIFDTANDTLRYSLSTGSYADFGNLRIRLSRELVNPAILQLTDSRGNVVRESIAESGQVFEFNHLSPGNYVVRLIDDINGNGKWDTGNYLQRIQPERVYYYPNEIEVRANWELEQQFNLPD